MSPTASMTTSIIAMFPSLGFYKKEHMPFGGARFDVRQKGA
jgi:hypothetical protein